MELGKSGKGHLPQATQGGVRYGKIWGRAFWDVDMCTGPETGTGFIALREEQVKQSKPV